MFQINRLSQPLQDISVLHHLQVGPNFPTPTLTLPVVTSEVPGPTHQTHRNSTSKSQLGSFSSQGPTKAAAHSRPYESVNVTQYQYPATRPQGYPENLPTRLDETTFVSDTNQYCK